MLAILDEAGRKFNADEADGVSRRHRLLRRLSARDWVLLGVVTK
jgi:hypothetical protein